MLIELNIEVSNMEVMGILIGVVLAKYWRWLFDWGWFNRECRNKIGGSLYGYVFKENLLKGKERNGIIVGSSEISRGLFLKKMGGSNKNMFLYLLILLLFWYM